MTLRDALQQVYDRHGKLTPQLVVDEARADEGEVGTLLRNRLEWDDETAGEAWRRTQAQEMIRSVRVIYRAATKKAAERSVRAFCAVKREDGYGYEPVEEVIEDPFTRRLVMADMEREWKTLKQRYDRFREFAEMVRTDLAEAA